MPKLNHENLGGIMRDVFLPGVILETYPESPDTPPEKWDTADVEISTDFSPSGETYLNIPIFYHCDNYRDYRANRAIQDGARGFSRGDNVVCRCHLPQPGHQVTDPEGNPRQFEEVMVVAHAGGPKKCEYNYVFVRAGLNELEELEPPFGEWEYYEESEWWEYFRHDEESLKDEYCTIYDMLTGDLAKIPNLEINLNAESRDDWEFYEFPISLNEIKPYLDTALFRGQELFIRAEQGDSEIRWAKAESINWREDHNGYDIMDADGASLGGHFLEYQFKFDPIEEKFNKLREAFQVEGDGVLDGTWPKIQEKFDSYYDTFQEYKGRSKAFDLVENNGILVDGSSSGESESEWNPATKPMPNEVALEIARLKTQLNQIEIAIQDQDNLITQHELDIMRYEAKIPELEEERAVLEEKKQEALDTADALENAGWLEPAAMAREQAALLQEEINNIENQISGFQDAISFAQEAISRAEEEKEELRDQIVDIEQLIVDLQNGENPFSSMVAKGVDGQRLSGNSVEARTAYGENEIWACGMNTYQGMVVSYCDEKWKFLRVQDFLPVIPIGMTDPKFWGTTAGNEAKMMADVSMSLAAAATKAPLQGDSIFVQGGLKRLNEGYFHRTSWPAITNQVVRTWAEKDIQTEKQEHVPDLSIDTETFPASVSAQTLPIPEDTENEPSYMTAINTRLEKTQVWHRWDNWMNTMNCMYATEQMMDLTWFFDSNGQEWGMTQFFWDTPIGSMYLIPPSFNAGLWLLQGLNLSNSVFTCRKDWPLHLKTHQITKHSAKSVLQIYVVQRQAVTLWNEDQGSFCVQNEYFGPYQSVVEQHKQNDEYETPHPVSYTTNGHAFFELPEEHRDEEPDRYDYLDTLFLMRDDDKRNSMQGNRHELEVHAAVDLYNDLEAEHERRCPTDQERNQDLENCIYDLCEHILTLPDDPEDDPKDLPKEFTPLYVTADLL